MTKKDFIRMVESLLNGVKDNCLSPEDFMMRINELYEKEKERDFVGDVVRGIKK